MDCEGLGCEFPENDMEKRDERKSDAKGDAFDDMRIPNPEVLKERPDHRRHIRFPDPAEGKAGDRDAQLRGGEIGIQMGDQFVRNLCPPVSLGGQRLNLGCPDLDDGKLGGDEKAVQKDEKQDQQNLSC